MLRQAMHPQDFAAAQTRSLSGPRAKRGARGAGGGSEAATLCTTRDVRGGVAARVGRPAVVVSSTSWTADEDFGLLLRAAHLYDAEVCRGLRGSVASFFLLGFACMCADSRARVSGGWGLDGLGGGGRRDKRISHRANTAVHLFLLHGQF